MSEDTDQYQNLIAKFSVGIYIWHLDDEQDELSFKLLAVNKRAETETGVPCEDVIGKRISAVFPAMITASYTTLFKQVVLAKNSCNFGVVPYGDQRIKMSHFKMRAYPLPAKCMALLMENADLTAFDSKQDEEFSSLVTTIEASIDSLIHDFYATSKEAIFSHILCHLVSFYARQQTEVNGQDIMGKDVTLVVDMLLSEKEKSSEKILITYPYFTTTSILFNILILRWMSQPPTQTKEVERTQLRILTVLGDWIEFHFYHLYAERQLITRVRNFLLYIVGRSKFESVQDEKFFILTLLDEQLLKKQNSTLSIALKPLTAHVPRKIVDVLQYTPTMLARQLTMIYAERFASLMPYELHRGNWMSENNKFLAPNVTSIIELNNRITNWVISEIVSSSQQDRRCNVIKFFIEVAYEAMQHNDFETSLTIGMALQNSSVSRLQNTWKALDQKTLKLWNKVEPIAHPIRNFFKYREILAEHISKLKALSEDIRYPLMPYFAVYLRDIIVINDTNDTRTDDKINWEKMDMIAAPISQLLFLQRKAFTFTRDLDIKSFLLHNLLILGDSEQYEYSKVIESIVQLLMMIQSRSLDTTPLARLFNLKKKKDEKPSLSRTNSSSSVIVSSPDNSLVFGNYGRSLKDSREEFDLKFEEIIVQEKETAKASQLRTVDKLVAKMEAIIAASDEPDKKQLKEMIENKLLRTSNQYSIRRAFSLDV